ncbi:Winged helix-turn helix, partial [Lampropedia hyalina DSM 16112]
MDKDDARRLSPAEQHERRRQVIRSFKRGTNKRQIGRDIGLSYSAVCTTIERYETGGAKSLAPRQRGRKVGEQRSLSAQQEAHLQRLICERRPEQLKMDFA